MKRFARISLALVIAVPGAAGAQGRTPTQISPGAPAIGTPSVPPAAAPGRPASPTSTTPRLQQQLTMAHENNRRANERRHS